MSVTVERHEPNPEHGRPRILTLRSPEGELAVHCDREDGSLWAFAKGPRGGDGGRWCVGVRRAPELLAWLEQPVPDSFYGAQHWLRLRRDARDPDQAGWELLLFKSIMGRHFKLILDDAARDELRRCLREWAEACVRMGATA